MAHKLDITPELAAAITAATAGGTDPNSVSVFETVSLNSLPVNKRGGIFQGAVHPENTLRQMAAAASGKPMARSIPLHTMHQQGYELPVGQVFDAKYIPEANNGMGELRSLFFLPNTETDLINKLDTGTISEVSVGVRYQHLNCSQCGWDYMGDDANMMNFYDTVCANDHVVGEDGTHVICNGLAQWMEQSLVSLGAAQGAKIVPKLKSLLGNESYTALAASGIDPCATTLFATPTTPKENDMDMKELIADLTTAKASVLVKDGELATLTATAAASVKTIGELTASVAALTAENETLKAGDVTKFKTERDAAFTFVRTEADRLCVAVGVAKLSDTATLDEMKASIESNRTKLSASIPTGGRAEGSLAGSGTSVSEMATSSHAASFSTK